MKENEKRCSVCKKDLPATPEFFYRKRSRKDGFSSKCKGCENEKIKERLSLPDVRERKLAYDKAYARRLEVREHRKKYCDVYFSDPEVQKHATVRRKGYRQLPKVRGNRRVADHTRRMRKKAILGVFTSRQIQEQLKRQRYRCYYAACGYAKFEKCDGKYIYHIDHTFPVSRIAGMDIPANDIGYLVLACPSCNHKKSNKFPWEWPEGGRLL
jgi:hypothetical protein